MLIYLFSGMNGTAIWIVAWTLMSSTLNGGILCSGTNGRSMPRKALEQVGYAFLKHTHNSLTDISDDQTAEIDHSKTIKTPIIIAHGADGEPVLPTITMADSYQAKVVQSALRNYCTAHISE
jgi:hypothetical protein